MNIFPLHAPDLPVLFLAILGRFAGEVPYSHATDVSRLVLSTQLLRRSRVPLPDDVVGQVAEELVHLSRTISSRKDLIAHFDEMEQAARYIALGVEVALAGQIVGLPLFAAVASSAAKYGMEA